MPDRVHPDAIVAEDLGYLDVPSYRYPWVLPQPLQEDLLRPQGATAENRSFIAAARS